MHDDRAVSATRERIPASGKALRLTATVVFGGLLLAGTLIGEDDAFPFGPFRMYATTDSLDAPVRSTRMEAIDSTSRRFALRDSHVGLRRAEIEGQMKRFEREPEAMGGIAAAYHHRHPLRPRLTRIEIITRHFELADGRPTGKHHDTVELVWSEEAVLP
jgi:hypothetical protein